MEPICAIHRKEVGGSVVKKYFSVLHNTLELESRNENETDANVEEDGATLDTD